MRAYCITLPETPDRTAALKEHLLAVGPGGTKTSFVDGIHAKSFGLLTCHPYEVDHPGTGYMIPQKHVGLCLSHYLVWSIARHSGEPGPFMVIEDDAEFAPDWQERLRRALDDTPDDADLLMIGNCNCAGKPTRHVAGEVHHVQWPQATHAYVVWPQALPRLLATQRDVWAPIDLALIFRSYPTLNVYTVLPRIVGQRNMELAP